MERQNFTESHEQEIVEQSSLHWEKAVLGPGTCGHHCSLREVVEKSPNGVLLVDTDTCVYYVNSAFRKMFRCDDEDILGQPAMQFVHCDCFEKAIDNGEMFTVKDTISGSDYNLVYRAKIFPVDGGKFYCGIFVNVSEKEEVTKHYYKVKAQTLDHAQEVISRQMKTAQEIAKLLGETTAETKVLLVKLMSLFEEESQ